MSYTISIHDSCANPSIVGCTEEQGSKNMLHMKEASELKAGNASEPPEKCKLNKAVPNHQTWPSLPPAFCLLPRSLSPSRLRSNPPLTPPPPTHNVSKLQISKSSIPVPKPNNHKP